MAEEVEAGCPGSSCVKSTLFVLLHKKGGDQDEKQSSIQKRPNFKMVKQMVSNTEIIIVSTVHGGLPEDGDAHQVWPLVPKESHELSVTH